MTKTTVSPPMVADLEVLRPSFVRHLRAENKSSQTIAAYNYAVTGPAEYLVANGMPTAVSAIAREHVEAFFVDLLERAAPPRRRTTATAASSSSSPGPSRKARFERPRCSTYHRRRSRARGRGLSDDELRTLLATYDPKTVEDRRDRAILRVFMDSGLRLAEVTNLRARGEAGSDVDLDGGVLRVTRKGRRTGEQGAPTSPTKVKVAYFMLS